MTGTAIDDAERAEAVAAFCAEVAVDGPDRATLASLLAAGIALARSEHPTVVVAPGAFATRCARCVDSAAPLASLERLQWADLWLVTAAIDGAPAAWSVLEARYFSGSARALARLRLPADRLDDIVQQVRVRLFFPGPRGVAKLEQYRASGALAAWLKMVTVRFALDALGKRNVEVPVLSEGFWEVVPAPGDDVEMALLRRQYGAELKEVVEQVAAEMAEDDRVVLRYSLVEGLTIDDIALVLDVHRSTVARRINKAREALAHDARVRLAQRLGLDSAQLVSVMRLIDTQLELSLQRVLAPER